MNFSGIKDKVLGKLQRRHKEDKRRLTKLVESHKFDMFIVSIILADALVLGLMTSDYFDFYFDRGLFLLDRLFMGIFIVEMLMKIYVYRKAFFKSGWNVFDFVIVAVSSVPFASAFIVFRTFRVFRLLKYLDRFKTLNDMVEIFIKLLPVFASLVGIVAVLMYSFAIIGVSLYGGVFANFNNLGSALFVLIQAFTLDGWASTIARPVMAVYPDAWLYFTSFILLSFLIVISFVMTSINKVVSFFKR